jgi:hypothetical protein
LTTEKKLPPKGQSRQKIKSLRTQIMEDCPNESIRFDQCAALKGKSKVSSSEDTSKPGTLTGSIASE